MWIWVISLQVWHQVGVPYHHELREKNPGIDRSRGVRTRSAQEHCVTPSRRKVLEVWKSRIFREISPDPAKSVSPLGGGPLNPSPRVFPQHLASVTIRIQQIITATEMEAGL